MAGEAQTLWEQITPLVLAVVGVFTGYIALRRNRDNLKAPVDLKSADTIGITIASLLSQREKDSARIDDISARLNTAQQTLIHQAGQIGKLEGEIEGLKSLRLALEEKIRLLTAELKRVTAERDAALKSNAELQETNENLHELLSEAKQMLASCEARLKKLCP